MKVILVVACSVDGKTTKWHDGTAHEWVSKEDQEHFSSLIKQQTILVMGKQTYLDARTRMKLSPKTLRVVMTKTPEKYQENAVPGQLEFTSLSPCELLNKLQQQGHQQVLLLTGETLSTLFFREKLVNEIWITLEPVLFGTGKNLVSLEKFEVVLQIQSVEKLNKRGTLLLKYTVVESTSLEP